MSLLLISCLSGVANGQTPPELPADTPVGPIPAGLTEKPVVFKKIGFRMHAPLESMVAPDLQSAGVAYLIREATQRPTWSMSIQPRAYDVADNTPKGVIEDFLDDFALQGTRFTVLANEPFNCGRTLGHLCIIERQVEDQYAINAWLILHEVGRSYIVLALGTDRPTLERMEPTLRAAWSTIRIQTRAEVAAYRLARLEAGQRFLKTITEERLRQTLGQSTWLRHYQPASDETGGVELEIGYTAIQVNEEKRGKLTPGRSEDRYQAEDHVLGLMVRVFTRSIADPKFGAYYDKADACWLAWDRSEESWSVRLTRRQGQSLVSESETGIRTARTTGDLFGSITVIPSRDAPSQWATPTVYLSQAEERILGLLMPIDADEAIDMSCYYYDPATRRIVQRSDEWAHPGDKPDEWTHTATARPDNRPSITSYDADGRFLRRRNADGSMTEPIDYDKLVELWRSKGLRTRAGG